MGFKKGGRRFVESLDSYGARRLLTRSVAGHHLFIFRSRSSQQIIAVVELRRAATPCFTVDVSLACCGSEFVRYKHMEGPGHGSYSRSDCCLRATAD